MRSVGQVRLEARAGVLRRIEVDPGLIDAVSLVGSIQIQSRATLAGNLCNASPSADNAPTLLAMGASINIAGPGGGRSLPLDQFFQGPGITALEKGEIVTSVVVPLPPAGSGTAYLSLSQRGKLMTDERTNTLIITDIPDKIPGIIELVETLDRATKQVLIEARVVETKSTFQKEIGIQWGFNGMYDSSMGTQTGMSFPNSIVIPFIRWRLPLRIVVQTCDGFL